MFTTDHIFPVLPIKYLINKDGDPTTSYKLATGMKPSVSNLRVLFFFMCCTESYCTRWDKGVNMSHQAQKRFRGIFVGIPQHQRVDLVYVPTSRKIISSYDVVFDDIFSSSLAYT